LSGYDHATAAAPVGLAITQVGQQASVDTIVREAMRRRPMG
jgi:hypothetical protein